MADFPALPLFTDSWTADTMHLSDEEAGAYMRLLILCWRTPTCKIPNDKIWQMRKLAVIESKYNLIYFPLIKEFFTTDGNRVFQKRLLKEFKYLTHRSQLQSVRAKSRYNKDKYPYHGDDGGTCPPPHPTPPLNNPLSPPERGAVLGKEESKPKRSRKFKYKPGEEWKHALL